MLLWYANEVRGLFGLSVSDCSSSATEVGGGRGRGSKPKVGLESTTSSLCSFAVLSVLKLLSIEVREGLFDSSADPRSSLLAL